MEDTLKKRALQRSKAKAAASGLSDADKILLQLLLDLREFGRELETHGVAVSSSESYLALLEMVRPAERFLSTGDGAVAGAEAGTATS